MLSDLLPQVFSWISTKMDNPDISVSQPLLHCYTYRKDNIFMEHWRKWVRLLAACNNQLWRIHSQILRMPLD
jgi:hypothetical protein